MAGAFEQTWLLARLSPYAPLPMPNVSENDTVQRASVLIPLFLRSNGNVEVLLTVRSFNLSSHAGEVAFPGS